MDNKQKRLTIGVLAGGILDDFTKVVCRGILRAAKRLNINVVVFPGKYLDRDLSDNQELRYEYQFNTIFSYAEKEKIDAVLVMAGSIGYCTSMDRVKQMLSNYKMPCVLIASQIDGYVDVGYDNRDGVRQALEYLIREVKCRRIGMIGGSSTNLDAQERKETFFSVLKEYKLPVEDDLYIEGTLTRQNREIVSAFLDRNPGLDAVFCVNDDTALGLYEELKRRDIQPGRDISVVAFDDIFWRTGDGTDAGKTEELKDTMHQLWDYVMWEADKDQPFSNENDVRVYLDRLLDLQIMHDADVENVLGIVEKAHGLLRTQLTDPQALYRAEQQFSLAYRRIIRAMDYEDGRKKEVQQRDNYSMKLFVRDMLEFENGNDQSYALVLNNLEWLHIEHAFLYALEEP